MRHFALLLLVLPLVASGDSWQFPPERDVTEFVFGDTRILRIVDATEDQVYPEFIIDIYRSGELVGRYGGMSFEHLSAGPNNEVFVGISNDGLPGTALVVFDAAGRLRLMLDHVTDAHLLTYCRRSVSRVREWFDSAAPNLEILDVEDGRDVQFRGCDGKTIKLSNLFP